MLRWQKGWEPLLQRKTRKTDGLILLIQFFYIMQNLKNAILHQVDRLSDSRDKSIYETLYKNQKSKMKFVSDKLI